MTDEVLVRAEHICKYFKIGGGRMLHAVEDINLDIHRGETPAANPRWAAP